MKETTFNKTKYNICWISMLVIFIGAIVYPITFAYYESNKATKVELVLPSMLPSVVLEQANNEAQVTPTQTPKQKPQFTRDLKLGDKGPEVKKLQEYLNKRGFIVAESGNGSPGQESDLFGPGTAKALKKFQEAYAEILLKPYGLKEGTGYLGEITRNFINS